MPYAARKRPLERFAALARQCCPKRWQGALGAVSSASRGIAARGAMPSRAGARSASAHDVRIREAFLKTEKTIWVFVELF